MSESRVDIHPSARIAENVEIGPWAVIGADVEIGEGCYIGPHVVIQGPTRIGKNNRFYQFASIGADPQDKKYHGERSQLEIGDGNTFREFTTINRGTEAGGGVTRIGNDNWIMAYVHMAHDCIVGDHTIFANNASLAGHVIVEDHAIISAMAGVHQFCRIGQHSFVAKATYITQDVLPYILVSGYTPKACGLNTTGLKRREFSAPTMLALKRAYKVIFNKGLSVADAVEQLHAMRESCAEIEPLIDGLLQSTRGIVR